MNFSELCRERYSCRSFLEMMPEEEKIDAVKTAAVLAPTAKNYQPLKILELRGEYTEPVKKCTPCHFNAPIIFVICFDEKEVWRNEKEDVGAGYVDAAIVATHMALMATEQGLGTTMVGFFDPVKLREELRLKADLKPVLLLPTGYPSDDSQKSERHFIRKEKSQIFFKTYKDME